MVFQSAALFDYLNVRDNILFGVKRWSKRTSKEQADLVNATLQSLLDAKVMQNGVEVTEGQDTALDPVVFEL